MLKKMFHFIFVFLDSRKMVIEDSKRVDHNLHFVINARFQQLKDHKLLSLFLLKLLGGFIYKKMRKSYNKSQ